MKYAEGDNGFSSDSEGGSAVEAARGDGERGIRLEMDAEATESSTNYVVRPLPVGVLGTLLASSMDESRPEVQAAISEALRVSEWLYGEEAAIQWAEGFTFDKEIVAKEEAELMSMGGPAAFQSFMQLIQSRRKPNRMNSERIASYRDDPEYSRLEDLVRGIAIMTDDAFEESPPPAMRKRYLRVAAAANKILNGLFTQGLVTILRMEIAQQIPGISFVPAHWTTKAMKPSGRFIVDASASEGGQTPLNTLAVKAACIERWGELHHPTIQSIVEMIVSMAERWGWDNISLWKTDLRGAFHLLDLRPESVVLTAMELTDGLVAMFNSGFFGWTGLPQAFGVITRVLERRVNGVISGCVKGYVDDFLGCSLHKHVPDDMAKAVEEYKLLLGPRAHADDKDECGRLLDMLGWSIDLDSKTITLSQRNRLKTLHGMLLVDVSQPVPVAEVEKLASWMSRYGLVLPMLIPLSRPMYSAIAGRRNDKASVVLEEAAQQAILIWKCALIGLASSGRLLARHMVTLVRNVYEECTVRVRFDGCPTGVGWVVQKFVGNEQEDHVDCPVTEHNVTAWGSEVLWEELENNSKYQNTSELIAAVLGLAWVAANIGRGTGVELVGDSVTVLQWVSGERFSGEFGRVAAIMMMALVTSGRIKVLSSVHVPAAENQFCDHLSRNRIPGNLRDENRGLFGDILQLMNPMVDMEFIDVLGRMEKMWGGDN
jgi:hypothetical protein